MKVSEVRALLRGMDSDDEIIVHLWTHDDAIEMCDNMLTAHISKSDWRKVIRAFNRDETLIKPIVAFIEDRIASYTDEYGDDEYDDDDD